MASWASRRINGIRGTFGEEAVAIEAAVAAANRRWHNWIFPLLITLLLIGVNAAITVTTGMTSWPILITRIIVFDYLVFFFGWLAGWNSASKWRRNQDFLCELTVTPLSPAVVGNLLFAGTLTVWWKCFLLMAATDILLHVYVLGTSIPDERFLPVLILALPFWIVALVLLAWFHLETMRLAHWMFAITALPGLNLIHRAISMFFQILGFVTALTMLGSAITGAFLLVLMVAGTMITHVVGDDIGFGIKLSEFMEIQPNPTWHLAAIGGLLGVGILKISIARGYEKTFWNRYLMFTWWGSAERNHPGTYPVLYVQRAAQYVRSIANKEGATAKVPPPPKFPDAAAGL